MQNRSTPSPPCSQFIGSTWWSKSISLDYRTSNSLESGWDWITNRGEPFFFHFPLFYPPSRYFRGMSPQHALMYLYKVEKMYFWLFCSITSPRVAFIFNSIVLLCFKYTQGLTETPSENILVYESWPFKLEVSLVWSLAQRGRGRKTKQEAGWQRRTTMNWFSTFVVFFFVSVRLQKHSQRSSSPWTEAELLLKQKSRSCHEITSVIICSIWLMWQKKKQHR